MLELSSGSHACESENASPQPSNIVDDEPPELNTASQDSQITTSNQPSSSTRTSRKKRKRRGSTHRDRELTPLSTESEDDEIPLSVLVRRPSTLSQTNGNEMKTRPKYTCQECSEEFDKIYLYETHKETVHSSYPIDASPNIDTIKIILHSNMLKFKCKLCTFQSESQWETRRHQSTMHTPAKQPKRTNVPVPTVARPGGQKLVKILSLSAIAERVPLIKKNKNLTADQRLKMFYGFSCSRCKPPFELCSLTEFEKHSEETHNLTDISWLCCEVKLRNHLLQQHLNYHLGLPYIGVERDNFLYKATHSDVLTAIKKRKLGNKSFIDLQSQVPAQELPVTKKKKGGWPKGKPRTKKE